MTKLRLTFFAGFAVLCLSVVGMLAWWGVWIPNRPPVETHPVRGIDVSHHQGEIAWKMVDRSRVQFAYIKATEGGDYQDQAFAKNWREAAAAGIARGAYHFYTLGTPGRVQAANFIANVPVEAGALPPAVDLEISGYNTRHTQAPAELQRELVVFMKEVKKRYQKTPVIYTSASFRADFLSNFPVERLWIREVFWKPAGDWMFWQFSGRGRLRGLAPPVDMNVFRGSRAEFVALLDDEVAATEVVR